MTQIRVGSSCSASVTGRSVRAGTMIFMGYWDASGNAFPTNNLGSGSGGVIKKGNVFEISVAGAPGNVELNPGAKIMAKVDEPAGGWSNSGWTVLSY